MLCLAERLLLSGLGGLYGWSPGMPPTRTQPNGPGARTSFPKLLVAELGTCRTIMTSGTQHGASYVTNQVLDRLLHGSTLLEELDIGGTRVTAEGLAQIPKVACVRGLPAASGRPLLPLGIPDMEVALPGSQGHHAAGRRTRLCGE